MPTSDTSASDTNGSLPNEIVQSIAISNATAIGSQPAILANLALANEILNTNLQQQAQIAQQQAVSLLTLAVVAKSVATILRDNPAAAAAPDVKELLDLLKSIQPSAPAPQTPQPAK